jgi:hypothetical protein
LRVQNGESKLSKIDYELCTSKFVKLRAGRQEGDSKVVGERRQEKAKVTADIVKLITSSYEIRFEG